MPHASTRLLLLLVAASLAPASNIAAAHAAEKPDQTRATARDHMQWRRDGAVLALRGEGNVIVVEQATADTGLGLQAGDRLHSVDGAPLARIADLTEALRAANGRPVTLSVRRNRQTISITLRANAYMPLIAPSPPAPPGR